MSRATVELDFFGMEKENPSKSQFQKFLDQRKTIRDIQSAISKINPQLLKTVIASGTAEGSLDGKFQVNGGIFRQNGGKLPPENPFSVPSTPKENQCLPSNLPVLDRFPRSISDLPSETAPLTIFYNGTVSIFDVPRDKAEKIIKLAEIGNAKAVEMADPSDEQHLLENFNGDLPIARSKSLQRFFEKRKERLTLISPYGSSSACSVEKKLTVACVQPYRP
ncbi:PREDICTED: protein TIFY 9 [Nelumbo nucifera]|uniref:Protein TIFY n=1 Tax=Nelumbo nucifera TaxID=4432 RepID=A0A1U7ZMG1_NELNU|nr:PREDICTED: protein TIFY 9 [Nelumbo nucifera]